MLSADNLKELRHSLAHLSLPAVQEFYETAYRLRGHPKPANEGHLKTGQRE